MIFIDLIDFSFIDTVQWIYDFGDGVGVSFEQNPSYTYMSPGVYDITLNVVSDIGCSSELIKEVMIYDLPTPKFKVDSNLCLGDALVVSYVTDNNANIVAWNYNFGDGYSSSEQNPIYEYSCSGTFDISLDVISSEGCKNFAVASTVVRVNNLPIVDFKANKLIASEMFPEISFYNLSEGAMFYEWNFDNGDYSFEENPIYSFSNPDIYNVTLAVIDSFGCTGEMVKSVQINPEHTFFIPDSFTPDGDGLNDFFLAKANSVISYQMQVFDRWGRVVFESDNIDFGWNGENPLGIRLDKGVYLYHVKLYDENGKLWVYNGELNLMR